MFCWFLFLSAWMFSLFFIRKRSSRSQRETLVIYVNALWGMWEKLSGTNSSDVTSGPPIESQEWRSPTWQIPDWEIYKKYRIVTLGLIWFLTTVFFCCFFFNSSTSTVGFIPIVLNFCFIFTSLLIWGGFNCSDAWMSLFSFCGASLSILSYQGLVFFFTEWCRFPFCLKEPPD